MTTVENKEFNSIYTLQNNNKKETPVDDSEAKETDNQPSNLFLILWSTVQQWAEDTTFHCVKYVFGQKVNIIRRLFWLAAIVLMWYGLVSLHLSQTQRFFNYKPITRETVRFEQQIEFPSVTVCSTCHVYDNNNTDPLEKQIIIAALESVNSGNLTYTFGNISYKHMSLHEKTLNMSTPAETLFYMCMWKGTILNCSERMKPHYVLYNLCYTFNYDEPPGTFVSKTTGSYSGLYMMMFLDQDNCLANGRFNAAGIYIMLHDVTEEPDFNKAITLAPGFHHSIGVTKSEKRHLPSPVKAFGDSECIDTSGDFTNPLKYFSHYSMHACEQECFTNYVNRTCQCVMTVTDTLELCDFYTEVQCAVPAYMEFWENWQEYVQACGCVVPCSYTTYSSHVSSLYMPDRHFKLPPKQHGGRELNYSDKDYIRENFVSVELFYDTKMVHVTEQILEFTRDDLLAAFGGYLGLALGASIMTVIELLEMMAIAIFRVCRGIACRQRI